ncbi:MULTISPECIES: radical SAM protein [Pseudothermotoga]|uniref:radical SAM protein n=1 Tax=Pseudothermotoga TaxID=1643951 RepID=UPI0004E23221|nr:MULTISPECIES: radical SAM protein [Pseudothermotoga]MBC7122323.1 radical SAM protein [Pseudothermotoga sp.]MDI6861789.1 radical SAM protein [Pseudothermotoga sp.]
MVERVIDWFKNNLSNCRLCPLSCGADRRRRVGHCGVGARPKLSSVVLHFGEEPPISGETGAGTIFFTGCNMRCIYCQNMNFSQKGLGTEVSTQELAEFFLDLQQSGAKTLNLVTPTPNITFTVEALLFAKERGFNLPVVYNTSSYENVETLRRLEGIVDIYLADLRYADDETGWKYSKVPNYFSVASKALVEMHRQVGPFDEKRMKGLIVRHLVLPNDVAKSQRVLDFIYFCLSPSVPVSIMSQYNPVFGARTDPVIGRRINKEEYERVIDYALKLGLNGWMQTDEKKRVTVKAVTSAYKIIEKMRSRASREPLLNR